MGRPKSISSHRRSQEYTMPWDLPLNSHTISFSWEWSHTDTVPGERWDGISRRISHIFPATIRKISEKLSDLAPSYALFPSLDPYIILLAQPQNFVTQNRVVRVVPNFLVETLHLTQLSEILSCRYYSSGSLVCPIQKSLSDSSAAGISSFPTSVHMIS